VGDGSGVALAVAVGVSDGSVAVGDGSAVGSGWVAAAVGAAACPRGVKVGIGVGVGRGVCAPGALPPASQAIANANVNSSRDAMMGRVFMGLDLLGKGNGASIARSELDVNCHECIDVLRRLW
jgi:hypothetical protein